MKMFRAIVPALAAVCLSASFVATPVRAADKEESVLHVQMEAMGKSVKALRKSIKDPAKKEESLKHVADMKKQAQLCAAETPDVVKKAPEAEKAKILAGYKEMMAKTIVELEKLEKLIADGKSEEAQEAVKGLKGLEDEGHEKYNP
jgi:soluble cytochrome b562